MAKSGSDAEGASRISRLASAGLFHLRTIRSPAWATRIAHSPVPAARRAQGDHLTDARLPSPSCSCPRDNLSRRVRLFFIGASMLRGIGRLRAGGSFNPSSLFAAGEAGLWAASSDLSSAWQESAGTTPGAVNSPVGKRDDKSGNANHLLQATSAARPTLKLDSGIYSDLMDGTDDGYATAAFSAGTLTSDMDAFIAVKRNSAAAVILCSQDTAAIKLFGYAQSGVAGASIQGCGSANSTYVNNTLVGSATTTAGQLHTAMPVGEWLIYEARNLDLSAWTALSLSTFSLHLLNGNIGEAILVPALSDARRTQTRQYLAAKFGVSL